MIELPDPVVAQTSDAQALPGFEPKCLVDNKNGAHFLPVLSIRQACSYRRKDVTSMWNKVLLASAVVGLVASIAIPIHSTPAQAAAGCAKEAKVRYAGDAAQRKAFKHWCNNKWKLYKASAKGAPKA